MTDEGQDVKPLHASPRLLALVAGVFVVILGIPSALLVATGRWPWALGMLAAWAVMVVATAYGLRKAVGLQD